MKASSLCGSDLRAIYRPEQQGTGPEAYRGVIAGHEPSPLLIHKQLTLHGSWVCSIGRMEELVEHLVRWDLHPEVLVTHRFPLEQAREAYETFDQGHTGKVAIVWE